MNALDYIRLLMTAKRNFYSHISTPTAEFKAEIYDEVICLINDIEKELPFERSEDLKKQNEFHVKGNSNE